MADRDVFNVLFLCTGNSARSIMAEGLANHLSGGVLQGFSAGSHPRGVPHPVALRLLRDRGIATGGLRSKSWSEFALPGAPQMHCVITVCDQAAGEACPIWPGHPVTVHWGLPDPASVGGSGTAERAAFEGVFMVLEARIKRLAALPLQTLDASTLKRRIQELGDDFTERR
jgi:arsenate reductase